MHVWHGDQPLISTGSALDYKPGWHRNGMRCGERSSRGYMCLPAGRSMLCGKDETSSGRPKHWRTRQRGHSQGGCGASGGEADCIGACQRGWLARDVPNRRREPSTPRLATGETEKVDQIPCCRRLILFELRNIQGDRITVHLRGHLMVATTLQSCGL